MLKKIFRGAIIFFLLIFISFGLIYFFKNEKLPVGNISEKADSLAYKMNKALNKNAWDSTNIISWTHKGLHKYIWDKKNNKVLVSWGKNEVFLNLKDWKKGKAFSEGKEIKDEKLDVLRGKAYTYFCNDSFWLIAPFKVFDEGVSRKIVKIAPNKEALLVSYSSGGITPEDSYLWYLDDKYVPTHFKMWVKIIPIGGISATWENWMKTSNGVSIATKHKLGPINIEINNLKTGDKFKDLGIDNYKEFF